MTVSSEDDSLYMSVVYIEFLTIYIMSFLGSAGAHRLHIEHIELNYYPESMIILEAKVDLVIHVFICCHILDSLRGRVCIDMKIKILLAYAVILYGLIFTNTI